MENPTPNEAKTPETNTLATWEALVTHAKVARVSLDACLQQLKQRPPSRETSLAITKVQEGIMWMGMELKRLGTENPYPNSYDPSNTKIEPTADGMKM